MVDKLASGKEGGEGRDSYIKRTRQHRAHGLKFASALRDNTYLLSYVSGWEGGSGGGSLT